MPGGAATFGGTGGGGCPSHAQFAPSPSSSSSDTDTDMGFSNNNPHGYSPTFRPHYTVHNGPTMAYRCSNSQQCSYYPERFYQQQAHQQEHQHDHEYSHHQFQQYQHQHNQHAAAAQNKEHQETTHAPPRSYNLPPNIGNVGFATPQRLYLPIATSSAQSLSSSPFYPPATATGNVTPGSGKPDGSRYNNSAPTQLFHSGISSCGLFRPLGSRTNPSRGENGSSTNYYPVDKET